MRSAAWVLLPILLMLPSLSSGLTWTRVTAIPGVEMQAVRLQGSALYVAGNDRVYILYL